jgi:acyl carrier protein
VAGFAKDYRARVGISLAEGAEALERGLAAGLPSLIVTPQDLDRVLALFGGLTAELLLGPAVASGTVYPRPALRTPYAEPRSDVERKLVAIWQRTLGIEPVGIHDSFFELGGNSLSAIQVFSQLKKELRLQGSIALLFEAPTIATLAAQLAGGAQSTAQALDQRSERGRRRRAAGQQPRRQRPERGAPAGRENGS